MYLLWQGENRMNYQVTFTAMWNTEIEADSREEAVEILEKDWDKIVSEPVIVYPFELRYYDGERVRLDSKLMNVEADIEDEGYDE